MLFAAIVKKKEKKCCLLTPLGFKVLPEKKAGE